MIRRLLLTVSLLSLCLFVMPQPASAFDPFKKCSDPGADQSTCIDCSSADNAKSAVCTDSQTPGNDPIGGTNGIIGKATNLIAIAAGVAAIILLLIASLRFITAAGDANKAKSARATIINTLIGLAVIVLVRTIVLYVVSKLS